MPGDEAYKQRVFGLMLVGQFTSPSMHALDLQLTARPRDLLARLSAGHPAYSWAPDLLASASAGPPAYCLVHDASGFLLHQWWACFLAPSMQQLRLYKLMSLQPILIILSLQQVTLLS